MAASPGRGASPGASWCCASGSWGPARPDDRRALRRPHASYIGAESLRRMGLPNPIVALENGTMGWQLAGLNLERGAGRWAPAPSAAAGRWPPRSPADRDDDGVAA